MAEKKLKMTKTEKAAEHHTFDIVASEDGNVAILIDSHDFWLDDMERCRVRYCIKQAINCEVFNVPTATYGTMIPYANGIMAVHLSVSKLNKEATDFMILVSYMTPKMKSYRSHMFFVPRQVLDRYDNVLEGVTPA